MRGFLKSAAIFAVTLGICGGLLFCVCALIPQSAIQPAMQQAEAYFSALQGSVRVLDGVENTRADDYADIALFDVIYHVDASRPLYSMIAAPYYRNEGGDIRLDFRASVVEGQQPNGEYARYWHGSQVLLRPLLTFTSIHGCRAALFGLLCSLDIFVRNKVVHDQCDLFTVEYTGKTVFLKFVDRNRSCDVVAKYHGEFCFDELTRYYFVQSCACCEDLLSHCHSHNFFLPFKIMQASG